MNDKEFDLIVYGASGFTGRLVAEYLGRAAPAGLRWAMAGRSEAKLAEVRAEMGLPESLPLVVADADDSAALEAMCARTKAVVTTTGPFQLYGSKLVAACVKTGTDYADLCGEPAWMAEMIAAHQDAAKASGARIVLSAGFDSIPFDMGVFFLQEAAKERFGAPCPRVDGRVEQMKGTFSGGTAASLQATMAAAGKDPSLIEVLKSPFALTPGFDGPKQPSSRIAYDEDLESWAAPFLMAPINTKNVHRSNFLLDHAYGKDFEYSEMILTGPGERGEKIAGIVAKDNSLMGPDAPKPGEGPSLEERESGHYAVLFRGKSATGEEIRARVTGDRDPGYGSTSKMLAETGLCLALDGLETPGGVWTTAPALGTALITRLRERAGLTFDLID